MPGAMLLKLSLLCVFCTNFMYGHHIYGFLTTVSLFIVDLCVWGKLPVSWIQAGQLTAAQIHREGAEHGAYTGGEIICS